MKTTRAKFVCDQVVATRFGSEIAELYAVLADSEENRPFNKASPNGKVSIMIDNPDAKGFFVPGKEYYFDITAADQPKPIEEESSAAAPDAASVAEPGSIEYPDSATDLPT